MDQEQRLLLVEDDETIRALLRRYLQGKGYAVSEAADGELALAAVQEGRFDLVLLDYLLPGRNGLDVLCCIRQTHSATDLPIIMATSRHSSADVIEALHLGANDYLVKPFDFAVALARIQTQLALKRSVDQIARLEQNLAQRNAELEAANKELAEANRHMRHDLEAAAKVQQALLPDSAPAVAGARFAWQFKPCAELAGDLLNVVVCDERRVALYVLDVMGHGVKASLLAVMVSRVLGQMLAAPGPRPSAAGQRVVAPAAVAEHLDWAFPWDDRTQQFFTLLYGVLDLGTRTFEYVSAGHPGPIHLPRGEKARSLNGRGGLIGLGTGRYKGSSVSLGAGDRLYLYSDGLAEAKNRDRQDFGKEQVLQAIEASRGLPLDASLAALLRGAEAWCGPAAPHDDISLLAVEVGEDISEHPGRS
jgi:sigma-B regulation protein RsbU (phosphoserine phosphatase)